MRPCLNIGSRDANRPSERYRGERRSALEYQIAVADFLRRGRPPNENSADRNM